MFLSSRNFFRHKAYCIPIMTGFEKNKEESPHDYDNFMEEILSNFTETEVGNLCSSDEFIKQVGYRHYCKGKQDKINDDEVKDNVLTYMQRLGHLFLTFKDLSSGDVTTDDMFTCQHLSTLREAMKELSDHSNDGDDKGSKLSSMVERTVKSLKEFYVETAQFDKEAGIQKFDLEFRALEIASGSVYGPGSLSKKSQRPCRPCVYCDQVVYGGKLKRHILRHHKDLPEVKEALKMPKEMAAKFFNLQKTEGIYKYNQKLLKSSNSAELLRERHTKSKGELLMCAGCKKFLSKATFYKHKLRCNSFTPEPVKVDRIKDKSFEEEEFVDDTMNVYSDNKLDSWLLPQDEGGNNEEDMEADDDDDEEDEDVDDHLEGIGDGEKGGVILNV